MKELDILKQNFIIGHLDIKAAVIAAQLQRGDMIRQLQADFDLDRDCIKTDALIIGIAIAGFASQIITNNYKHFKVLARGQIPVSGVPEAKYQGDFGFGEQ